MAITRRQFVTRLGALAAAAGMSQVELTRITQALGYIDPAKTLFGTLNKPRVIWVHGQECTGCSTSVLGFLERSDGHPIYGDNATTTLDALLLAGEDATTTPTLTGGLRVDANASGAIMLNIADVVIDVIDLQYHETVMGMGADLAAQWLNDFVVNGGGDPLATDSTFRAPFVLVTEGALADKAGAGAWGSSGSGSWCSIGMSQNFNGVEDATHFEIDMPSTVAALAKMPNCLSILPIGQCACYGGYPASLPALSSDPEFDVTESQTGAKGTYAYLSGSSDPDVVNAAGKVINTPGCPTNPFWFVLTVLGVMIDLQAVLGRGGGIGVLSGLTPNPAALDGASSRRLKMVYPIPIHSAYCPRYKYFTKGIYATKPGGTGCLQKIGCKGPYTRSLCGAHGWNNFQPQNGASQTIPGNKGGSHCTMAGHPCMGCTEPGYPNRFVPFVKL